MEKKRALIVNNPGFRNVGGIEKYLYGLMTYCVESGIRVIWMCHSKPIVCDSFKALLLSDSIERVPVKALNWYWYQYDSIPLKESERYVIISCTPQGMCTSQDIMLRYKKHDIFPVYAMANTTGAFYFLERYFKSRLIRRKVFSIMRKMMLRWELSNGIRFFSASHADALEKNYRIEIKDKDNKVLKSTDKTIDPDFSIVGKRYKKSRDFIILTVGRLCFPHKGYMLGLVRTYGKLKKKYPNMQLHIVGDGQDKDVLVKEIKQQPQIVQDSIKMFGEVSPDQLHIYYQQSDLNISVAGAAMLGAASGTLTIVARNYCEGDCEVYGFYDDCPNKSTSTGSGNSVDQYIVQALEMSDEEYLNRCIKGYDTFCRLSEYNPEYLFDSTEGLIFSASKKEVRQMKLLKRLIKVSHYLNCF